MDSLDLYRRVIAPTPGRETTDALLLAILSWVGESAPPERVFSGQQLDAWALRNGYSKVANADLLALLRRALACVPVGNGPDDLAGLINDALYAHGG